MMKVAIVGYGNLGKSLEKAISNQPDMQLVGIFSRRVLQHEKYIDISQLDEYVGKIDCLALAMGSYDDIVKYQQLFAGKFHTVDSYDNHNHIPQYKTAFEELCRNNNKVSIVCVGWDPGLMSIQRALFSMLPNSKTSSFWGKGVSQGHSNAIRSIQGVTNAIQYTIPKDGIVERTVTAKLDSTDYTKTHYRLCYVSCLQDADKDRIKREIVNMPDYFLPYQTQVVFTTDQQITAMQQDLSHRGYIVSHGDVASFTFALSTNSNPDLTANIMCCYIRATEQLASDNQYGCLDCLDIAPKYLIQDKSML